MADTDVYMQKGALQSSVSGAGGGSKKSLRPGPSSFLDLCRGLAASVVVISHAEEIFDIHIFRLSGAMGVSVFFLLSGFLITISIRNHLDARQDRLSVFLSDRFARIATPYLPILVVVALINVWFVSGNWGQFGVNRGLYALLGNALFLNDYPIFQALSNRWSVADFYVRSYNTAEPFWTIPIEFWIYVGVGLFAFCLLGRERLRGSFIFVSLSLCLPVIIWNSFAGGGKCLTLVWLVGAFFAFLWLSLEKYAGQIAKIGLVLTLFGAVALAGKIAKTSFDPHDLQTDFFMACILFGATFLLSESRLPSFFHKIALALASYSYSLYLVHNTVLIVVKEHSSVTYLSYGLSIVLAHCISIAAYLVFERHHRHVSRFVRPFMSRLVNPGATPVETMSASRKI